MLMDGKLLKTSNLSNSTARATDFTKMTTYSKRFNRGKLAERLSRTWLNSRVSSKSFNFLFFFTSSNLTKCCWSPCSVNFVSSSTKISRG